MKTTSIFLLLMFTLGAKAQDTTILKTAILTESLLVYSDSMGFNIAGRIEKAKGVFVIAPNKNSYFLVYRDGVLGYSSKSFIELSDYWARKLNYNNLDIKIANAKKQELELEKQIKLNHEQDSIQERNELLKSINYNSKNGVNISSFEPMISDYTAGFSIIIENYRKSKIKYSYITVSGYNPVNDLEGTKTFTCVGPIDYIDLSSYVFEKAFYSKVISQLKIRKVVIEYMDGVKKTFEGPSLKAIINLK